MATQRAPLYQDADYPQPALVSDGLGGGSIVRAPRPSVAPVGTMFQPATPITSGTTTEAQSVPTGGIYNQARAAAGVQPTSAPAPAVGGQNEAAPKPALPPSSAPPITSPSMPMIDPSAPGLFTGGNPGVVPPAAGPTATPGAGVGGTALTPIDPNAQPTQILPTGTGRNADLLAQLQDEASRQLQQPTVYDDPLYQSALALRNANTDERFKGEQQDLNENLSGRGLSYSSVYGGRLNDLKTAQSREKAQNENDLLTQRALALAQGRTAAFNNAAGLQTTVAGQELSGRNELRNERSYLDNLDQVAHDQALQEWLAGQSQTNTEQDQLLRLLGIGSTYGLEGLDTSSGAARILGQGADAQDTLANASSDELAQLAALLPGLFGKKAA